MLTIRIETAKFLVGYFSEKPHFFSEERLGLNELGIRRFRNGKMGKWEDGKMGRWENECGVGAALCGRPDVWARKCRGLAA